MRCSGCSAAIAASWRRSWNDRARRGRPLVAVAAGAPAGGKTSAAAALSLAYFLSSLAFVRAYRKKKSEGRVATGACLGAHAVIVASLCALAWSSWIPVLALLAFTPVLARTLWAWRSRRVTSRSWLARGRSRSHLPRCRLRSASGVIVSVHDRPWDQSRSSHPRIPGGSEHARNGQRDQDRLHRSRPGVPLVFLHGFPLSRGAWRGQVDG